MQNCKKHKEFNKQINTTKNVKELRFDTRKTKEMQSDEQGERTPSENRI